MSALLDKAAIKRTLSQHFPLAYQAYRNGRVFLTAAKNGLLGRLLTTERLSGQSITRWRISAVPASTVDEFREFLSRSKIPFSEGRHCFYLAGQDLTSSPFAAIAAGYPSPCGLKILKDFTSPESASYLTGDSRIRMRRALTGSPMRQTRVANYMYKLGIGARLWDVCAIDTGRYSLTAFVVEHVQGAAPTTSECTEFKERLDTTLRTSLLRLPYPRWSERSDFRCPGCNGNLIKSDRDHELKYIDFQNFAIASDERWISEVVARGKSDLHFGRGRLWRGDQYLYQSIPGQRISGKRDVSVRWSLITQMLAAEGIRWDGRTVLDIGCNAGMMLYSALSSGARWGLGWDLENVVPQSEELLFSLGATRFELKGAHLSSTYPLAADIPEHVRPELDQSIVLYLSVVQHIGILEDLFKIPWCAMVFEGHQRISAEQLEEQLRPFINHGCKLARLESAADGDSRSRPLAVVLR
jgi:hypothetical protein